MYPGRPSQNNTNDAGDKMKRIKCVVWDLDNTLWQGTLLEDRSVLLREKAAEVIRILDSRGILHSIASRNDYETAMQKLDEFGMSEYFLYPQISWNSKSSCIEKIADALNIAVNSFAFIDDQPFEREEVSTSCAGVMCIDASDIGGLPDMPEFNPRFITADSRLRRQMYINDITRSRQEEEFIGPKEEFLASLNMKLNIFSAAEEDLPRAEELTIRTNQLNATGYTYSYDELSRFCQSDCHMLLMARLEDRFGSYGHIGLALIEKDIDIWTIKLLLMSCRVMSRGVGSIMLNHIMQLAKNNNVRLRAEFLPNGKNRMMEIMYRFAGFENMYEVDRISVLENRLQQVQKSPDYVEVTIRERA